MTVPHLGDPRYASPISQTVTDDTFVPEHILEGPEESDHSAGARFELAGPRARIFFDPTRTRAGIVTCGGLCPGLNDVIRSVFRELRLGYGVDTIVGFRGGYQGLDPAIGEKPIALTPEFVEGIHQQGGSVLGTSRGPVDIPRAVDHLIGRGINVLFTIGGDGTQRGAAALFEEATRRGYALAVVGIPKTIDNDVAFVARSFGYLTAVEEAAKVLDRAHTEARSVDYGVALVKLMGRHAGFIAVGATVASQDVNVALIPEVAFALDGPRALLPWLVHRLRDRRHAVIAVAEGAGQDLLAARSERDASGNVRFSDVGLFLRERIEAHAKTAGLPIVMRYIDPSYLLRSTPANAADSILCDQFARHAVHAAMAGKTGLVIGLLHDYFVHVPIALLTGRTKRVDPDGAAWRAVLASTGQPARFE